jgi:hypothetical protein
VESLKREAIRPAAICDAINDFHARTLSRIPSPLDRLIYVASTRDYNSGRYHHDGLAARFGEAAAADALAQCHAEIFETLAFMPLRQVVAEVHLYMEASREQPAAFLNSWWKLEPFRVAIPLQADPIVAELFISNVRITLAILRYRLQADRSVLPDASPPQSLGPQSRLRHRM